MILTFIFIYIHIFFLDVKKVFSLEYKHNIDETVGNICSCLFYGDNWSFDLFIQLIPEKEITYRNCLWTLVNR